MPQAKKEINNLAGKLIVSLMAGMVVIFIVHGIMIFSSQKDHLEESVADSAILIVDTLNASISHNMLSSDCYHAFEILTTVVQNPDINGIRIFDNQGKIVRSSVEAELGQVVDMASEQCIECHRLEGAPATTINRDRRWRYFRADNGDRVLGLTTPIENEPDCSSTECHYHSEEKAILGVLDVQMSMKRVDDSLQSASSVMLVIYIVAVLIMLIICMVFIYLVIHKPLLELRHGIHIIASGNLEYQISLDSHDELGELAKSFNHMVDELRVAQEEAADWASKLEERVREKTEELNKTHVRMIHAEKMVSLGKLAAIVAHEINNPLAGVLTYTKLIKRKVSKSLENELPLSKEASEESVDNLGIMEQELARCGEIVSNLLVFAKRSGANFSSCDVNAIIKAGIRLVQHQLNLNSIELTTDLAEDLPEAVCDKGQIEQVVIALLINAIEAIGDEGLIKVRTSIYEDGNYFLMEISDNGCGMDAETKKHIFDPFFTTKEGTNGAGLGLSVVYGIIEKHKGVIRVVTEEGKGTTFKIRLPFKMEEGTEQTEYLNLQRHVDI